MLPIPTRTIARTQLSGTSGSETLTVSTAGLPFTARHLVVTVNGIATTGTPNILMRLNGDTGSNYNYQTLKGASTTASAARGSGATSILLGTLSSTSNEYSGGQVLIPDALSTRSHSSVLALSGAVEDDVHAVSGRWANTAAVTSVTIMTSASTFAAGSTFELAVVDELFAIREVILAADGQFTVDGLPDLDGDVVFIMNARSDASADEDTIDIDLNDDSTDGSYARQYLRGDSTTASAAAASDREIGVCTANTATASAFGAVVGMISSVNNGINDPHMLVLSGHHADSSDSQVQITSGRRNNVARSSKLELAPASGTNFKTNSMLSAYHMPKNVIGYKKLESDASSIAFSDIPDGYLHLKATVYVQADSASASRDLDIQFNSDSSMSNYNYQMLSGVDSTVAATTSASDNLIMRVPGTTTDNVFGGGSIFFPNYAKTDRNNHALSVNGAADTDVALLSIHWESTAAITTLTFSPAGGENFKAGSIIVLEAIGGATYEDNYLQGEYVIEIDWDNDGKFDGTGEDVTARCMGVTWQRGRSSYLTVNALSNPGKAQINLLNDSADYSPLNTSSAIYPNVLPGRKVRIRQTHPVAQVEWTGFIGDLNLTQHVTGFHEVQLRCIGPFDVLNRATVDATLASNVNTGTAVAALLDDADWDSTARDIDTGLTTMTKYWSGPQKAIGAIREVELTESGFLREGKYGKIRFENRHHRLSAPHTVSQATFSDSSTSAFRYSKLKQEDPSKGIYNDFRSPVHLFANGSANAVLWKHPEAYTGSSTVPEIEPGKSVLFWAAYPSRPDVPGTGEYGTSIGIAVSDWVTPSATLDWNVWNTTGGASAGGATLLNALVSVSTFDEFANAAKVELSNTGTRSVYLTDFRLRGTALMALDGVTMQATSADSQSTFGKRTYNRRERAKWIPNTQEAQDWCDAGVSVWKAPQGFLTMTYLANTNLYGLSKAARLDVTDRITFEGTGAGSLGIVGDYFIEQEKHTIKANRNHLVQYLLTPVGGFAGYWVTDVSTLTVDTRPYY